MSVKETESEVAQLCPTLWDPMDLGPPGSSIYGIFQARILEWVAISFSNACVLAKSLQSCPTLCDSIDSSPPGSSDHRILQARILECGEGNGNPFQYSRLENRMDRGAWQATVHRMAELDTT